MLLVAGLSTQAAIAQVAATRYQRPGADCALFPAGKFIYDITGEDGIVGDSITGRFTPTKQQVDSIENLLLVLLRNMATSPRFRGKERYYKKYLRPLPKSLKRYRRQYFGFYNGRHQPCLYINFFTPNVTYVNWLLRTVIVSDGGFMEDDSPNLWQVSFNLTTQQLYNFNL